MGGGWWGSDIALGMGNGGRKGAGWTNSGEARLEDRLEVDVERVSRGWTGARLAGVGEVCRRLDDEKEQSDDRVWIGRR